jgi:phosphomannomutase
LSQLIDDLPKHYLIKERIDCPNAHKQLVLEKLRKKTAGMNRLSIDDVKVFFDDGSILIRLSGTEAIYRVYAEATKKERAREIADWGIFLIQKLL